MANIVGVQTVDGVYVINVDADPSTGGGTSAPLGSIALANNGAGTFTKTSVSDTGWSVNPSATFLGVARYIYLVNDATDATKLGGSTNNVYSTSQTAYDAANTLQVLLGGSIKVVVVVGNTIAATVGNIILAANWNANVIFSGINSNVSNIGTITSTTFTVVATFVNISCGNITTSAGGAITLTLKNAVVGNLTTTATVTSGAITVNNSYDSTIGTITSTSSLASISTLTYTTCSNVTTGTISFTQTSSVASFSIGAFTMTTCDNCRFGAYTATMAFATSTGTVGGLNINNTNQGILFSGVITIQGYTNITGATSDTVVSNIIINNTTFNANFLVNGRNAAGDTPTGGVVTNVNINNTTFNSTRNKLMYNATTATLTTASFSIRNSNLTNSTSASGLNIFTYNTSFTTFIADNCFVAAGGGGIWINNSSSPIAFLGGVNPVRISNIKGSGDVAVEIFGVATLGFDDVELKNISTNLSFSVYGGDMNANIVDCNSDIELGDVGGAVVKRTKISQCNLSATETTGAAAMLPITIKGSNLSIDTTLTLNVTSYGSTVDAYISGAITIAGTLTTSTISRKNTSTLTATLNNSYDESLA